MRFEVRVPHVEELTRGEPRQLVLENAARKARAVPGRRVLAADTAVALEGEVFGKPEDRAQAGNFLRRLSGRAHEVWSGLSVVEGGVQRGEAVVTHVRFRTLGPELLDWYLATEEWRGRAGAYAIQGKGAALVQEIDGDYWNVVGLPVATLLELLPDVLGSA